MKTEEIHAFETSLHTRAYGVTSQKTAFFIVTAVSLKQQDLPLNIKQTRERIHSQVEETSVATRIDHLALQYPPNRSVRRSLVTDTVVPSSPILSP
jgi:hypothetical protein